jgi:hypothetical protein
MSTLKRNQHFTSATLDSKHTEQMNMFTLEENKLSKLRGKKNRIKHLLTSTTDIETKLSLTDEIIIIKRQIKEIKSLRSQYYLTNGNIIFKYFESKQNISKNNNIKKSLNSFFNVNNSIIEETNTENKDITTYLLNIDETFLDINKYVQQIDICRHCNKGELIPVDYEGILVCNKCSRHKMYLVENEKPSYKDPPKEVCFYAYKRINHFREILAQSQAKETTLIPQEILDALKQKIDKDRMNIEDLTTLYTKNMLKQLGYSKYYEHIPFIKEKLGIKPPVMSQELEETLCNLFMEIQAPYAKYCPDDRVNFLNYYYTVYKLCELLNQKEFLTYFPMLKDRDNRIEQDNIWKNICDELDWEFIPTI